MRLCHYVTALWIVAKRMWLCQFPPPFSALARVLYYVQGAFSFYFVLKYHEKTSAAVKCPLIMSLHQAQNLMAAGCYLPLILSYAKHTLWRQSLVSRLRCLSYPIAHGFTFSSIFIMLLQVTCLIYAFHARWTFRNGILTDQFLLCTTKTNCNLVSDLP